MVDLADINFRFFVSTCSIYSKNVINLNWRVYNYNFIENRAIL